MSASLGATFTPRQLLLDESAERGKAVKRIVLIPTKLDHAWATHMYTTASLQSIVLCSMAELSLVDIP
jgi:hypothetical protein